MGLTEPTTEAGRRLYAQSALLLTDDRQLSADRVPLAERLALLDDILAIEAEARAGALDVEVLARAWSDAEAALPKGGKDWAWKLRLIWHPLAAEPQDAYEARYDRTVYEFDGKPESYVGRGPTPAAALRAILADRTPETEG